MCWIPETDIFQGFFLKIKKNKKILITVVLKLEYFNPLYILALTAHIANIAFFLNSSLSSVIIDLFQRN